MRCEIVCGVWLNALSAIDGKIHRGGWTCIDGLWGEVRTECGEETLGYLTTEAATCEKCQAP